MKHIYFLLFTLCLISCSQENIQELYKKWQNKVINIPSNFKLSSLYDDSIYTNIAENYKIIVYADSFGCLTCKMNFKGWQRFNNKIDSITNGQIKLLMFLNTNRESDIKKIFERDNIYFSVCFDLNDEFNSLNHLPDNEAFHCFLLDENNRVVLIGNPVQNPKIKELYIRTICERLGIEQPTETSEPLRITNNLGVFDWRKEQQTTFVVRNSQNDDMSIDSLYSSCECTTATIDKTYIAKGDSAIVTVTYKAEKAEPFMREVYVHSANNQELTLAIKGEGIE